MKIELNSSELKVLSILVNTAHYDHYDLVTLSKKLADAMNDFEEYPEKHGRMNLMEIGQAYCLQYKDCADCPFKKKLCINNCGHITNFGRMTMLEDLVELTNELVKFDEEYLQ